jgi:hypothetical protein
LNEKVISILKTFDKNDIRNFKKFLDSPIFSTGRDLTKYYECIIKYHPEFEIDKGKFLKKYFGKSDDEEGKQSRILRAVSSDFGKALDEYITLMTMKSMNFYSEYLLIEGYSKRGLYELGERKTEEVLSGEEDSDSLFTKKLQVILLKNLYSNFKNMTNKNYEIYDVVESQSEDLLSFLFNFSSHILNSLNVNSTIFNIDRKTEQLSLLMDNINLDTFLENLRPDYPNYKRIKLDIILLCAVLKNKKFEHLYMKLNEVYFDTFDSLQDRNKTNYFLYVLNYYTLNLSEEIITLKFEFIKFGLSHGLFPMGEMKYIHPSSYKIFMLAGLHAGDIEWTEKYIEEYLEKVDPDIKENMHSYSHAYLAHYKKEYLKSIDFISEFKFGNEVFTYDMKLMQLKNYYELAKISGSYLESLNYSIDAFSHFLKENKKVSESYKNAGREFIAGMKLLIKAGLMPFTKQEKTDLNYSMEKFVSETKSLWMISKMKELL